MNEPEDFIINIVMIGLWVVLLYAAYDGITNTDHADFMRECLQYHKQYECTAMWRGKV